MFYTDPLYVISFSLLGCLGSFVKGHYFSTQGGSAFLYKTCPRCCVNIQRQGTEEEEGEALTLEFIPIRLSYFFWFLMTNF